MKEHDHSPFHRGEQTIQSRLGVRDKMESFGRQVIRDHLPEQHRDFYRQLPFVLLGHVDRNGWPWSSILCNPPGFITSPHPQQLHIQARPLPGDPLATALSNGGRLGLLGIELETRRRNRMSGRISAMDEQGFQVEVDQAFGNCPQYIQTRQHEFIDTDTIAATSVADIRKFDAAAKTLINNSDTFFVASYMRDGSDQISEGVDVSHRGGNPGFVRVDDPYTLTIPDYAGNLHFNTLGNFLENPKAGLLFLDFERGHVLTLTGTTEILWDSPETQHFAGAERLWRFHIHRGRWLRNVLPLRWRFDRFSPNTRLTGTWQQTEAIRTAERNRQRRTAYEVSAIVEESAVIKSFHLQPRQGGRPGFEAGQFLTLQASIAGVERTRCYTVSSAPADEGFRISVKREGAKDAFSRFLHDTIAVGDVLYAKAPAGAFTFDASKQRPAVLIGAGIGITPMVAMARHALIEGLRSRAPRPLTLISAAHDRHQRAFFSELNEIAADSQGSIRAFWVLSQVDETLQPGVDFHQRGRISKQLLQAVLPMDDYDCYLCGPAEFMQDLYTLLRSLGVSDARIHAESFGPASLIRDHDTPAAVEPVLAPAEQALVEFRASRFEQAWTTLDGSLLEFAEAHGLQPEYGCRSGHCGTCKLRLLEGSVSYRHPIAVPLADKEVLACCAVPAGNDSAIARLVVDL